MEERVLFRKKSAMEEQPIQPIRVKREGDTIVLIVENADYRVVVDLTLHGAKCLAIALLASLVAGPGR